MLRITRRASVPAVVSTALLTLALTATASATTPGRNGRIAFQAATDDGIQIFTIRPDGHDLRQVTHVDGDATLADWAPDGRQIAFSVDECSIAVIDADGSDYELLASDPDLCQTDPAFSADGERLVYERYDPVADVDAIWSMKVDGSDKHLLTLAGGADANVSPDGTRVSFKAGPFGALHVQNMDGSDLHQASPDWDIAYKHDWAPDGSRVVISDNSGRVPTTPSTSPRCDQTERACGSLRTTKDWFARTWGRTRPTASTSCSGSSGKGCTACTGCERTEANSTESSGQRHSCHDTSIGAQRRLDTLNPGRAKAIGGLRPPYLGLRPGGSLCSSALRIRSRPGSNSSP